jgi:hypothetical protein
MIKVVGELSVRQKACTKFVAVLLVFTFTLLLSSFPIHSGYVPPTQLNIGIDPSPTSDFASLSGIRPSGLVRTLINILLGGSGITAFLYLLWGGNQWITAGGDKDALDKARRKIVHAIIGLVIVFSSYALIFLASRFFGINVIRLPLNPIGTTNPAPTGPPIPVPPNMCNASPNPPVPVGTCSVGPCGGPTCLCRAAGSGCNSNSYAIWCAEPCTP